ncbi:MAG TPA: type II toxin-antitoxin system RelB/DinJ family antitoxin [Opitutaceae bacterium]|nr:type II toxin-antitoxin system RelB/DinJ family antitoxin [Opitutaceae bacterium]
MATSTILFRTRVPKQRLQRAEKILARLGLKPGDAVNMLLAQIEIRNGVPFSLSTQPSSLLSAQEQSTAWTEALGEY